MIKNQKNQLFNILLTIALGIVIVFACTIGPEKIPFFDSFKLLLNKVPFISGLIDISDIETKYATILYVIRVPRVLGAALIGMALAGSGVVFQGVLRNPLAEPYILGISSGAAFGATAMIVFGVSFTFLGLTAVSIGAFIGGLLTMYVVYNIARVGSKSSITVLILSGIAISSLLSSMVSLMISLNRDQVEKIVFWTMGSLSSVKMSHIEVVFVPILLSILVFLFFSRDLNVMLLGEESATSMGIDVVVLRKILLITASVATAFSVSISGIIGFVGLIVPHAMRLIVGPNHKYLTPASILSGAIFLILSDTIARTIIAPGQLPLGVITALIGAPYFIYLLYRNSNISRG
jgi:iron complex transport system permease protein